MKTSSTSTADQNSSGGNPFKQSSQTSQTMAWSGKKSSHLQKSKKMPIL